MKRENTAAKLTEAQQAAVIVYAETFGNARAAKAFNVAARTVQRYRALERDGELHPAASALLSEKRKRLREELGDESVRFLRRALKKMGELVDAAKPGEIGALREVAGALKVVFEANLVKEMLSSGEFPGADQQDPTPSETEGGVSTPDSSGVH